LELWTSSTDAEIRFTLDGSAPTNASALYGGPVSVTNTVQVRARAFAPGLLPGRCTAKLPSAQRERHQFHLQPAGHCHPQLCRGGIPVNTDAFVNMSFYEPQTGKTSLTNPPALSTRAEFTCAAPARRVCRSKAGPSSSGMISTIRKRLAIRTPADSDWVLYAPNNFEPVLIHNRLFTS